MTLHQLAVAGVLAWTVHVPDASGDPTGAFTVSLKVPPEAVTAVSTVAEPAGGW